MSSTNAHSIDMLSGPVFPKILLFSLPLAATGILQLLFNAADVIVVGKFAGGTSLAAVGATSSLINLLIGAFMGISIGVNILIARCIGCRQEEKVRRAVHCAFALGLVLGAMVLALGQDIRRVLPFSGKRRHRYAAASCAWSLRASMRRSTASA